SLSTLGRPDGIVAKCNVVRLDDYADAHDVTSLRLIKLDVEGAEFSALRGGETLLRRHHPLLLVELNYSTARAFGYHPREMLTWLQELDYQTYRIARGALKPVSRLDALKLDADNVLL